MAAREDQTDALLHLAGRGDDRARELLLARHRARLKRMVAVRIDGRLAARIDPSDVVQETLFEASRKMRHLEQMSISEIAAILGIDEGATKQRQTRALVRLQGLLVNESGDERR